MKITRLYLRNYRTFEDPVDLDLPSGLIGVYGANGAGKSFFVESVPFALYGRSRTTKDEVRTSGVGADCVVEVEFEHEDHLYLVRRTISGPSHAVRAEAHCDRLQVAEGARDTTRYVHSILGMDDAAFRASVFAEQKQLAAFSHQSPAERRRLVLQLLGITPVELARDRARRDAKAAGEEFQRLRQVLPDLDRLRAEVGEAEEAAEAAEATARAEDAAVEAADGRLEAARHECERLEARRQQHDLLVERGRSARAEHDGALRRADALEAELADLSGAAGRLAELNLVAQGLGDSERALSAVEEVVRTHGTLIALPLPARPDPPDEDGVDAAGEESERLRSQLAELDGRLCASNADRERAERAMALSSDLSREAHCPTCGQPLGAAFEQVQAHRAAELAEAEKAVDGLERSRTDAADRHQAARERAGRLRQDCLAARKAWETWQRAAEWRMSAATALIDALRALLGLAGDSSGAWREAAGALVPGGMPPVELRSEPDGDLESEVVIDESVLAGLAGELRDEVRERRAAAAECSRLQGRLERRETATAELSATRELAEETGGRLSELRRQVAELGHSAAELAGAHKDREQASGAVSSATAGARQASRNAERRRAEAESSAKRLAEAEQQHALIGDLGEDSRHLGRLAELLSSFRNSVVASAGPRLSAQSAELFAELTDHEYDLLQVDPETYEIQVLDQGVAHGMDRFSGSETDLANLSLRVAISEQVRFQSGGAVGLLVLDEVFGPLDEDRKERMLLALERLRSRFGQVVVVTHAADIKEQLPAAVEIVKQPGRRATARLL